MKNDELFMKAVLGVLSTIEYNLRSYSESKLEDLSIQELAMISSSLAVRDIESPAGTSAVLEMLVPTQDETTSAVVTIGSNIPVEYHVFREQKDFSDLDVYTEAMTVLQEEIMRVVQQKGMMEQFLHQVQTSPSEVIN